MCIILNYLADICLYIDQPQITAIHLLNNNNIIIIIIQ